MVMKMPLMNCRRKNWVLVASQQNIRPIGLSAMVSAIPDGERFSFADATQIMQKVLTSRQSVCRASVRTMFSMPPPLV